MNIDTVNRALSASIRKEMAENAELRREIERLRAGGCARDQSTTQYCAEAARLAEENEKLRAALQTIADMTDYGTETATWRMTSAIHNANVIARAALEGRDD